MNNLNLKKETQEIIIEIIDTINSVRKRKN